MNAARFDTLYDFPASAIARIQFARFNAPRFRIEAGPFRDKAEAQQLCHQLVDGRISAAIVSANDGTGWTVAIPTPAGRTLNWSLRHLDDVAPHSRAAIVGRGFRIDLTAER